MFFRNLIFFRFPSALGDKIHFNTDLEQMLAECALKPVGTLEVMSRGFVSPFGRGGETLTHQVGMCLWITVGGEERILPAAVIDEELGKRLAAVEEREGRKLGGRARKRLKEDVIHDLLPKALVRPSRVNAYLDLDRGFIAVDTSSRKRAEQVVTEVRHALGSFPALPLNAELSPRALMTGWIAGEPLPAGFGLGDECVLKDPVDGGAVVRCTHQELLGDEIKQHLESGKQASRLALAFEDHVSFVIGEDLVLRKVKLLDGALDTFEATERDSLNAELDARFALFSGEVGRLFDALAAALQLSKPVD